MVIRLGDTEAPLLGTGDLLGPWPEAEYVEASARAWLEVACFGTCSHVLLTEPT